MVIKTVPLKIHRPSARKRRTLDDALARYTLAFDRLLQRLRPKLAGFEGPPTRFALQKLMDKDVMRELNRYDVQPFKDALKMDVASTLLSYLARVSAGKTASYPVARLSDETFDKRFGVLCDVYLNGRQFHREYERLLKKYSALRPLLFCRHDVKRDYSLWYNEANKRFYAKLYLLNSKSPLALHGTGAETSALRYVGPGETRLEESMRPRRYIILPLSFGKWQERHLEMALKNPGILKTAQLVKRDGEYYLNVNMVCPTAGPIRVRSLMGVARSLQGCLAVGLHEHEHSEIYFGRVFSSEDAYEPQKIDNMFLHRLANEVVRLASAYGSQIILYTLGEKNDLLAFEDAKPLLNMREYNLLADLVSYKAELNGLPRPIKISPARVFHTCPVCGSNSRKNRMNRELFLCTGCGYIRNVEELGARNLALMIRTYEKNRIVFKTTKHEGSIRFTNAILGFEYESPLDEYAFDRFLEALRQSIADTHGISKQRLSIHKKLARLNDVRDGIRLVES